MWGEVIEGDVVLARSAKLLPSPRQIDKGLLGPSNDNGHPPGIGAEKGYKLFESLVRKPLESRWSL